ncbi:MAG TPA: ribonuclease III [Candidatus Paceibacterota bacterium]
MRDFAEFENIIGIEFENKNLLRQAFTHRSYLNENRGMKGGHNERLEFLGDAILELVVTHFLYDLYPVKTEGDLTSIRSALVNAQTCSTIANEIEVNDFLLLSRGEAKDVGRARQYILANTLEAVIGALYLDQGYEKSKDFIYKFITPLTEKIVKEGLWTDAKSRLQEKAQEIEGVTPSYKTIKEVGPDHDKKFTVGVYLGQDMVSQGEGDSKQEAEQEAAGYALKQKGWGN